MTAKLRLFAIALSIFALTLTLACGQAPAPPPMEPAAPANPLHGAWSVTKIVPGDGSPAIDPAQPGLYIFVDGYYSAVYTNGAEPRVPSAKPFEPTPEEQAAQYRTIIVNTGTYSASGATITFRPMVARAPGYVGGQATSDFTIDGDTLTLVEKSVVFADGAAIPNPGETLTLRRLP